MNGDTVVPYKPIDQITVKHVLWSFYADRPWLIVLYVVFMFYYPIRILAVPFFIGRFTTELYKEPHELDWPKMRKIGIVILCLWATALAMQAAVGFLDGYIGPQYQLYIRNYVINLVLRAYRRNYEEIDVGNVIVKIFDMPYSAFKLVRSMRATMLPIVLTLLSGIGFYAVTNKLLMGVFIGFLLLMVLIFIVVTKVMYGTLLQATEQQDQLHEDIEDIMSNLFALYVTDTVEFEQRRVQKASNEFRNIWSAAWYQESGFRVLTTFIKYSFIAIMVGAVIYLRKRGQLTQVASVLFITLTLDSVLYQSLAEYTDILYEVSDMVKMQNFFTAVQQRAVAAPPTDRDTLATPRGRIVYNNVSILRDGMDELLIRGATFTVDPKSKVLITGPIGSGKSTLVRVLAGLVPYLGSVTLDGNQVRDMSSTEIRRAVTYVPQSPRLFNRTVLENLLYGFEDQYTAKEVDAIMARLNIPNYPSLDMPVGKSGHKLSGGQRTIVYLVRAFLRKTPVIILDEPTASLDPETKDVVRRVVSELFFDRTVMVITHDMTVDWKETMELQVADHQVTVIQK